ncbi:MULTISPECIES: hypothetical protein [unclassified Microcoleus]|uniref:hypothetical protein n=1 Tax=unclassified Microcoleus TaxID=2642155 RepID=UPI002FD0907A
MVAGLLVRDFVTDSWLVGGAVSSGFCNGFSGWVVGGAAVSGGFGRGFSGWVVGGAAVSGGFGDLPLIIRYIRYIR